MITVLSSRCVLTDALPSGAPSCRNFTDPRCDRENRPPLAGRARCLMRHRNAQRASCTVKQLASYTFGVAIPEQRVVRPAEKRPTVNFEDYN
jgi:hypothetical protein